MRYRYTTGKNGRPVKRAVVYTQDEHGINFADVDPDAVYIIGRLKAGGYETYIVGGAVRDLILGKKPKDFDIVSEASPTRIKKIFRNARIIGRRFRLVHVYFGPKIFEVSTFRSLKDGTTSNTFGTIEEDVLRRDFSLNALFYDPGEQVVVDYVGGMKDIRDKRIRPIIPLGLIFKDDPVRMIRAVKYAATADFKLPMSLKWKIKGQSPLLASISHSRLTEELFKIIHSPYAERIVNDLDALGLYEYLQPDAVRMFRENLDFRTRYMKGLSGITGNERPGEALAALIRDYLEDFVDWDAGVTENYKNAFLGARQFVLPINPPRTELDQSVRLIFGEHGITIKKSRFLEWGKKTRRPAREPAEVPELPPEGALLKKKRPRRRRRRGGAGEPTPPLA
jgi:poly(A) polymerase